MQTVPVGMDEDDEILTSCVVEYTEAVPKDKRKQGPKGVIEKTVWQVVIDLQGIDGQAPTTGQVIDEVITRLPHDPAAKRDLRRQHALRALTSLQERGTVLVQGDRISLAGAGRGQA